eukprot:scaffold16543_cov72-Skeletonema_marinoi.AAC.1
MDNNGQERRKGAIPFLSAKWSGVPSEKLPSKDPHRHCPHRPGSSQILYCTHDTEYRGHSSPLV